MIYKEITTVLLLAAGMGSRLSPLTHDVPKCLTVVGGQPILGRLVDNLKAKGIKRLVVVTGHLESRIRDFLRRKASGMQVDFIFNPDYQTTNNIYSLWLARQQIREPFLLIESDLVFDASMLDGMLKPDRIAISNILPWMNGTTVQLDRSNGISSFHDKHDNQYGRRYKTVNIYSLSLNSWMKATARLKQFITGERLGEYYEAVFAEMVADGSLSFEAVFFAENRWYEIDTVGDLRHAERMYATWPMIN